MDPGSLISLCSAFAAILAAVYARWQATAAKKANEISLHENRLKVYSGLSRFRVHITGQGTNIKEEEVWRFAEIVELSEFYFSENISVRMNSVFDRSLKLLSLNDEWKTAKEFDHCTAKPLVQPRHDLMREIRDDCYKMTDDMKGVLRVGSA
ncbi:MAG: hypothetical protein JNN31_04020 [Dechloromonas sp.]|nr:hypothetical protein [Dechloromonas sp.]